MGFFLSGLLCSLLAFFAIRLTFKVEPREQIRIDAIIIGVFALMYVGGVGLIGGDPVMASLNMLGVATGLAIYRSCVGWPPRQTTADAFRRQKKPEPKFVAPEDDPNWTKYKYRP